MLCVVVVLVIVVVVVVVVVEGGVRRREETNQTIWAQVSLKIVQTEQPYNHPAADSLRSVPQESWS